jgi:hypothetical protein
MARRWITRLLALALVGAAICWWRQHRDAPTASVDPVPDDSTPATEPEPEPEPLSTWRDPVDGACPDGYPVKVGRSGLIHEPGGRSYDRTAPDRCYATAADAEADGYRRSKA